MEDLTDALDIPGTLRTPSGLAGKMYWFWLGQTATSRAGSRAKRGIPFKPGTPLRSLTAIRGKFAAFRPVSDTPLRTLALMTGLSKAELDAMIEEATIDCHDEEEALTGFATMIENDLEVPFTTVVLGIKVTVIRVAHTSHGLVADCVRGRHRQGIHILDLPLPEPPPKGAGWIAAYRRWVR